MKDFLKRVKNEILHIDTVRIGVPGILYVIENNLLFVALSNLSVAVYEVTDQVKILTTAVFSVYILDVKISRMQKVSLLLLMLGVGIGNSEFMLCACLIVYVVEFSNSNESHEKPNLEQNQAVGLGALLLACCISGMLSFAYLC